MRILLPTIIMFLFTETLISAQEVSFKPIVKTKYCQTVECLMDSSRRNIHENIQPNTVSTKYTLIEVEDVVINNKIGTVVLNVDDTKTNKYDTIQKSTWIDPYLKNCNKAPSQNFYYIQIFSMSSQTNYKFENPWENVELIESDNGSFKRYFIKNIGTTYCECQKFLNESGILQFFPDAFIKKFPGKFN